MKLFLTSIFFLVLTALSFGQTNFRPGYIITNSLDTIRGKIDYRGDVRNMKVCHFVSEVNSETQEYFPGQIHGYRFVDDGKYYISKYLDMEEVQDTVFVEFLLKGITNLYYYKKTFYSTYLLEEKGGELLELQQEEMEVKRDGKLYMVENNRYLGTLNYAFSDCPNLYNDIKKTELSHESLIKITRKYHDYVCDDEQCVIYEKSLPSLMVKIMPAIGYSMSSIHLTSLSFSDVEMDPSFSPFFGFWLDWHLPQVNERWSLLTGITLQEDYYFGHKENHPYAYASAYRDYHFFSTNVSTNLAFKYTYPKGDFVPVFFVGGSLIIEIDEEYTEVEEIVSNSRIKTNRNDLEEIYDFGFQPGFIIGGGIEVLSFPNLSLFANLTFSSVYNIDTEYYTLRTSRTAFSVGCIF